MRAHSLSVLRCMSPFAHVLLVELLRQIWDIHEQLLRMAWLWLIHSEEVRV